MSGSQEAVLRVMRVRSVLGTILALTGSVSAAAAAAEDKPSVDLALTYSCRFPLAPPRPVQARVSADVADRAAVGGQIEARDLKIRFVLDAHLVQGLKILGAGTVEASGAPDIDAVILGRKMTLGAPPLVVSPSQKLSAGPLSVTMTGPLPSVALHAAAIVDLYAGASFTAMATVRKADGTATGLGNPIVVRCTSVAKQFDRSLWLATVRVG